MLKGRAVPTFMWNTHEGHWPFELTPILTQNNKHNYDCVVWQHSVHCKWFKTQQARMDSSEFPAKKFIYIHTWQAISFIFTNRTHPNCSKNCILFEKQRKKTRRKYEFMQTSDKRQWQTSNSMKNTVASVATTAAACFLKHRFYSWADDHNATAGLCFSHRKWSAYT